MNKSELIKNLSEECDLSLDEATVFVNTFFDSVQDALVKDGRVELRGFGSFKVKHYKAYQGRNPKTGEKVKVPPKKLPAFRASKDIITL
ncbi:MAG: HU family DNA-binding protein [Desulfovibrionaceae bacterium]